MLRSVRKLITQPVYLLTVVAAIAFALASTLALRAVAANLGLAINRQVRDVILAVPVVIFCCVVGIWFLKRFISRHLRQELLDCDVPVCTECGYHLVGLPGPECPECGRPFDAQVRRILAAESPPPAAE